MAINDRGSRRVGVRTSSPTPVVEEIVPNSGWIEDSVCHYLLVDLPEFKKEEVKLQVDDGSGRLIVRGQRQANEQKRVHFELTFPIPVDSDVDKIAGNLDSEILYVIVPRRVSQENKESETKKATNGNVERSEEIEREETNADNEERDPSQEDYCDREKNERKYENEHMGVFSEELIRKWDQEPDMLKSAVEVLRRNKGVVITAIIAFSFGFYVSLKFQSSTAP